MNLNTPLLFSFFIFIFLSYSLQSDVDSHSLQFREKLIRDLNLIPYDEQNEGVAEVGKDDSIPLLVEKRINQPILGESGSSVSVEELGHHAGYYRLNSTYAAKMFYFFFESRGKSSDPVVIWLTGGPGCSSELALFLENGPYKIADNLSLSWNEFGWDKVSNIIYVDQPTGTGFSYSTDRRDTRHDEETISNDLYNFLQDFFTEHPEFLRNDFYIVGESYAGHFVPAFATRVHKRNKNKEGLHINLKGFAIGNGFTNPEIQYGSYADYALDTGLINNTVYKTISKIYPLCKTGIELCATNGTTACLASISICNSIIISILSLHKGINYYDIRTKCVGDNCYDFSKVEDLMNEESVKEVLGVGDRKFVSCNLAVKKALMADWMKNLAEGIPTLLEENIQLLVYAGEYDIICNWIGVHRWMNNMDWSGHEGFGNMNLTSFTIDGEEKGLIKSYGPLTFLKVYDAGHMVPMEQPKAALEILRRWTSGNLQQPHMNMLVQTTENNELLNAS